MRVWMHVCRKLFEGSHNRSEQAEGADRMSCVLFKCSDSCAGITSAIYLAVHWWLFDNAGMDCRIGLCARAGERTNRRRRRRRRLLMKFLVLLSQLRPLYNICRTFTPGAFAHVFHRKSYSLRPNGRCKSHVQSASKLTAIIVEIKLISIWLNRCIDSLNLENCLNYLDEIILYLSDINCR